MNGHGRGGRLPRKLATAAVRALYRRVEVVGEGDPITSGPQLAVANHFGGFADALLLISAMPRMPRILARDKIWETPLVGPAMDAIGAIKVHKRGEGPGSNDRMFSSAYEALGEGDALLIFPEGITRDDPSIAPIKTGAARIVLGARARGTAGIAVTPAGIHYEDKAALRSRVSIHVGRPLWVDAEVAGLEAAGHTVDADSREAVRDLTDDIEVRLRRVAPDFEDWEEARALTSGAEILVRSLQENPRAPVSIAVRDVVAGHLGRRPPEVKGAVVEAVASYERDLDAVGLTDAELTAGISGRRMIAYLAAWAVFVAVLAPFALVGLAINLIPALLVRATGLIRAAPAVLATLRPLAAIVAFGVTWGIVIWQSAARLGPIGAVIAALLLPVYGWAVIAVSERTVLLWRALRAWRGGRRGDVAGILDRDRAEVVAAVREAL